MKRMMIRKVLLAVLLMALPSCSADYITSQRQTMQWVMNNAHTRTYSSTLHDSTGGTTTCTTTVGRYESETYCY